MKKLNLSILLFICMLLSACNSKYFSPTPQSTIETCRLNDDISRLSIPATPHAMSLPEFGRSVIAWGTGPQDARQRFESIQVNEINEIKSKGATLQMMQAWQAFYENESQRNSCNQAAVYRAQLMKKIVLLWHDF